MVPAILLAMGGAFFNEDMKLPARPAGRRGRICGPVRHVFCWRSRSAPSWHASRARVSESPLASRRDSGGLRRLDHRPAGVFFALLITLLSAGLAAALFWFVRAVIQRRYTLFTPIPTGRSSSWAALS